MTKDGSPIYLPEHELKKDIEPKTRVLTVPEFSTPFGISLVFIQRINKDGALGEFEFPGGFIEMSDFNYGPQDYSFSAKRELYQELGLDERTYPCTLANLEWRDYGAVYLGEEIWNRESKSGQQSLFFQLMFLARFEVDNIPHLPLSHEHYNSKWYSLEKLIEDYDLSKRQFRSDFKITGITRSALENYLIMKELEEKRARNKEKWAKISKLF